jgi:LysR family transcriptional regulator, hydrogen peroxide-inducible genes activator
MPTIQQLRYLTALADKLHFRRAAEACNVTQPTLSAQLRELEGRLGVQLVERGKVTPALTSVGRAIADRARRILQEVEEIRAIASADARTMTQSVRCGIPPSLGAYLMPLIVPDLQARCPETTLFAREAQPDMLVSQLEAGKLDILLFPLNVHHEEMESLPLFAEPIHVVVPERHPLAQYAAIEPEMLRGETILTLEPGHKLFEQVHALAGSHGARLSRDFEGTSLDNLRKMVAMGMGISLMPALYVKSEVAGQSAVVARPFRRAPPVRLIGMVWRRSTTREEEYRFLAEMIRDILRVRAPEVTVLGSTAGPRAARPG